MSSIITIGEIIKVKITEKNEQGQDQVKYEEKTIQKYADMSWLEDENIERIAEIYRKKTYYTRFGGVVSAIAAQLATVHVPFLNKFPIQYRLAGVAGAFALGYALSHFTIGKQYAKQISNIIKQDDLIPFWNDKGRVLEKHNVYFFLDDDRGFSPNILYPGISEKQIDSTFPDGVYGNIKAKKAYLDKFIHLLQNKDPNQTNHLLEELSFSQRKATPRAHH